MKSGDGITAESIETEGEYPVYGGNGLRVYTSNYTHDGAFALIGRQGALCGNIHIVRGQFWASEHAVVATLGAGHNVNWFGAILTAMNLNQYSIAAAQPGLAVERVLNLLLPVPPKQAQAYCKPHRRVHFAHQRCYCPVQPPDRVAGRVPHSPDCRRDFRQAGRAGSCGAVAGGSRGTGRRLAAVHPR